MADLLHYSNLPNSSKFSCFSPLSLPLTLSSHSNFSFIRVAPLKRRFSPSSVLAKLSSHSAQLHIISRIEHADGSVTFKFGDTSEVSEAVDGLDGGNEVELEGKSDESLASEADAVAEDEIEETVAENFITSGVELKEVADEPVVDLQSDAQICEGSAEDGQNSGLISKEEVEDSSEFDSALVDNEVANDVFAVSDSSVDELIENLSEASEEMSDDDKLESQGYESSNVGVTSSDVEASSVVVALEDEIVKDENVEDVIVKDENVEDVIVKDEIVIEDVIVKDEVAKDEIAEDESVKDEITKDVIVKDEIEEDMTVSLENGIQNAGFLAVSHPISVDEDDDSVELMSKELKAEPVFDEEKNSDPLDDVLALGSSLSSNKVVDVASPVTGQSDEGPCTSDILKETGSEASGVILPESDLYSVDVDKSTSTLSVSSATASLSHSSEVTAVGHSSLARLDDDPHTHDTLDAAPPVIEASGITSTETKVDRVNSLNIEDVSSSVASSSAPLSSEIHDAMTHTIALSDGDGTDILVAAGPATSGIISPEVGDSLNKVETSAPAFSISSAVASLAHSPEALTGGMDAHFVSENWFGVADGVGQWSLGGVDMGLYAHEFMQNCEELLNSKSTGLTNVKELLQQSAAMTQSTGSARVLIAHVADQVLHVANIGDSGFVVIRNGTVIQKSSPMVHEFSFPYAIGLGDDSVEDAEEYHIDLEDGDVIVTATDGLFDNLYEQEIASIVSKAVEAGMSLQDLAELLATKAAEVGRSESARSPFADAVQAAGHPGYSGGKLDHVTIIVSLVQRR